MKKLFIFLTAVILILPGSFPAPSRAAVRPAFFQRYTVRYLFAWDESSPWTGEEKKEAVKKLSRACDFISEEAARYGCRLDFRLSPAPAYQSLSPISRNGSDFFSLLFHVREHLEEKEEGALYVILVNKSGPSYACPLSSQCVLYDQKFLSEEREEFSTYAHELLHLLGALDFSSLGAKTYEALKTHFPGGIMLNVSQEAEVTLFTARLLGWVQPARIS